MIPIPTIGQLILLSRFLPGMLASSSHFESKIDEYSGWIIAGGFFSNLFIAL